MSFSERRPLFLTYTLPATILSALPPPGFDAVVGVERSLCKKAQTALPATGEPDAAGSEHQLGFDGRHRVADRSRRWPGLPRRLVARQKVWLVPLGSCRRLDAWFGLRHVLDDQRDAQEAGLR